MDLPFVPQDRYFSIHMTDEEHYTVYDEVRPMGTYAFVRSGRGMQVPEDATVIECPEDYPHLFIRVQLRNDDDKPNAMAIQQQISLTGVSRALDFDNPIQFVLDTHDVYPQNEGLLESVVGDYDDEDQQRVAAFVDMRVRTIRNNIGAFGPIDSSEPGSNDPEIRAAAIIGHLGLPAEHAIYLPSFVNCEGEMLMGDRPEVFTFPYEPENVREFWSVTRYSLLTRNMLPGLNDIFNAYNTVLDDDGYVTITFSAEDPNDGTYWMPVIAGEPYYFIVRYYGPDLDALPPGPCDRA